LTVLAAIAGSTSRLRLGTAILVLTQRNPLEVAKVASSLDQISGGRLQLGVGAGWFEEEIRALGYEPRNRGRRLDEAIEVIRNCWTGETSQFAGTELSVESGVIFLPTPAQPTIPVLVGGMSEPALRRAALLGDGWIPDASIEMLDFDALFRRNRSSRLSASRLAAPDSHSSMFWWSIPPRIGSTSYRPLLGASASWASTSSSSSCRSRSLRASVDRSPRSELLSARERLAGERDGRSG
jgi:probable F420-dependent oxidoreductase